MLINKSMYPVKAGYSAISTMQSQLGKLQTQLGSGQKAQTLSEMGFDRTVSLATRNRLTKLDSFAANIDTVNLRLNFLDQAFTSLANLKSETRTSATPTSYGENNLTMVSLQKDSENRLSQLLETLNLSVAGRYLMGGNKTDTAPIATYNQIMNGDGTADGYLRVAEERRKADLGPDSNDTLANIGLPRTTVRGAWQNTMVMSSAEFERFGYKITSISGNSATTQTSGPTADPLAPIVQVSTQPIDGDAISITATRRDGTTAVFSAVAVAPPTVPDPFATPAQYSIGGNLEETAGNLQDLMAQKLGNLENFKQFSSSDADVKVVGYSDGMDAVSIKFDKSPAPGEMITIGIKRPDGVTQDFTFRAVNGPVDPLANPKEYAIGVSRGQSLKNLQETIVSTIGELEAPIKTGRLNAAVGIPDDKTVRLEEANPPTIFGYKLASASTTSSKINVSAIAGNPANMSVKFMGNPRAGESVTINLTMPDGTSTPVRLEAVDREPATGQFRIGANAEETAANFEAALKLKLDQTSKTELVAASSFAAADDFFTADGVARRLDLNGVDAENATVFAIANTRETVKWYTGEVGDPGDNPRHSATAQVDDSTKVGYGVRANEGGLRELVKTLAAMSSQEYDINDTTSKARFSAMVERQMASTSSSTATNDGSIEQIGLELGVVRATVGGASERNTAFAGQLETLLSQVETVSMEETVMQLLALKTRLEASYQTTATVAGLSLVNYLR
jgi:flagellar hook-associated protein 3 FlgL